MLDGTRIERDKNFLFALAVEDCISNKVLASSRKKGEKSIWEELPSKPTRVQEENKTTFISAVMKGFFDLKEIDELEEGPTIS
ncbi:MAG: hypothetical protein GY847_42150 [Proteobacteria bacterium]|nr:hypothetical protein [Pseudomonadota bacterium]